MTRRRPFGRGGRTSRRREPVALPSHTQCLAARAPPAVRQFRRFASKTVAVVARACAAAGRAFPRSQVLPHRRVLQNVRPERGWGHLRPGRRLALPSGWTPPRQWPVLTGRGRWTPRRKNAVFGLSRWGDRGRAPEYRRPSGAYCSSFRAGRRSPPKARQRPAHTSQCTDSAPSVVVQDVTPAGDEPAFAPASTSLAVTVDCRIGCPPRARAISPGEPTRADWAANLDPADARLAATQSRHDQTKFDFRPHLTGATRERKQSESRTKQLRVPRVRFQSRCRCRR